MTKDKIQEIDLCMNDHGYRNIPSVTNLRP